MQDGDVKKSHADVDDLVKDFEYSPKWNIQNGIRNFIQWYIHYYNIFVALYQLQYLPFHQCSLKQEYAKF